MKSPAHRDADKKMLLTYIFFSQIPGIVMNTFGGFMYTYTKYQEAQKKTFHKDENFNKVKVGESLDILPASHHSAQEASKDQLTLSEIKIS